MPDTDELEEELVALMRQTGRRNHRSRQDVITLLTRDSAPQPNKNKVMMWPAYKGPRSQETVNLGNVQPFGKGKYSEEGPFTAEDMVKLGIPGRFATTFSKAMNGSRARSTWKQRRSVLNIIENCRMDTGMPLEFPWGDEELQIFVGWCMEEDLQSNTIQQYVSNVRSLHKEIGTKMSESKWDLMRQALQGHSNLAMKRMGRVPMTPALLLKLKYRLRESKMELVEKRLIWTVCTALFQGSFRVGEILSPTTSRYCPTTTLTGKDVRIEKTPVGTKLTKLMKFKLRSPKERKGGGDVWVEMFDLGPECFYNCMAAWEKWREMSKIPLEPDAPVFRKEDGTLLTAKHLNAVLKTLLVKDVDYEGGTVATHSFRAGLTSVMGRLGYSNEEIMRQGRWQSSSFTAYLKLGRAERVEQQYKLASSILSHVSATVNMNV